jgi:hypothetical protein
MVRTVPPVNGLVLRPGEFLGMHLRNGAPCQGTHVQSAETIASTIAGSKTMTGPKFHSGAAKPDFPLEE